ncbi:helix-turn-helix transcriptional regulator [Pseudomonas sp.]|uniref:helix-turn-helix domain-containing protein n=1 Tax=unclassified Pseudomonas TaxID=196821 RepID=UPI0019B1844A|nr:helix-turn-helix transcriptional regulator [Pseudomonas sp.]MBC6624413.1 helix-turn-helix transcriptional regulator [Pseudomonas sp.]MBP6957002.1 helix-turn-helix transcriptional regulator [Pseudomonas sp.]
MRELNDAFALALRDMRHQANLAQNDFPPRVSREYISLLERGLRSPSLKVIDDLAEIMGISPLSLVLQCYLHRDPSTSFEALLAKAVRDVRVEMIPGKDEDVD